MRLHIIWIVSCIRLQAFGLMMSVEAICETLTGARKHPMENIPHVFARALSYSIIQLAEIS